MFDFYYITLASICKVYFTYKTYDPGDVLNQIGEDHALS